MPFALLLALAAIAGGTLLTYFYDREAPLLVRLAAGACTGFAALGLVGFLFASLLGLTPLALALSGASVAAPLALLSRQSWRARVRADLRVAEHDVKRALHMRGDDATATLLFYVAAALLFWLVFGRAMFETSEGIFTGIGNNIGDLPFHVSIITGFVYGENFPPQHTEFSGVRLTYPFLADFVAAMFVRAGAGLEGAMFWQNWTLALSFVGLLHYLAWKLTRDRLASLLTPLVVLFNGGLGFVLFWREARERGGSLTQMPANMLELLGNLSHNYSIHGQTYRWGNAITTLLVPQRGLLLGLPLALIVITLWWKATAFGEGKGEGEKGEGGRGKDGRRAHSPGPAGRRPQGRKKKGRRRPDEQTQTAEGRRNSAHPSNAPSPLPLSPFPPSSSFSQMIAAGIIAGLLPLVHAHSFVVLMTMGGCLALIFVGGQARRFRSPEGFAWREALREWRGWAAFFVVALAVAAPQMIWATRASAVNAGSFFEAHFGWDKGEQNFVWFWLKNTGLFIPLLVAALAWRGPLVRRRLLLFYLPFTLCFIVPNLYKLSPWVWDNIKVLFYWWMLSAPLVALLLAHLWRRGRALRLASAALLCTLALAGALDVWRVASGSERHLTFDRDGVAFAELIKRTTRPHSLILHAPTYNHPVYLTGRRTLSGYDGHLWSHGIDYAQRHADLQRIYAGSPTAAPLIEQYGIEYVVVSPVERAEFARAGVAVNETFLQNYTKVGEAGAYRLYKTTPP
jgi:hypothetical protein